MLRRMVGWIRYEAEEWSDTMRRMRDKVNAALRLHPVEDWNVQLLRRRHRMVRRFAENDGDRPVRASW